MDIPLQGPTVPWQWVARVGYLASMDAETDVTVGDTVTHVPIKAGVHQFYVVGEGAVDQVSFAGLLRHPVHAGRRRRCRPAAPADPPMTTVVTTPDVRRRDRTLSPGSVQVVALGLIATQAVLRGWTCVRGFFYLDDFSFTGRAMEYPLWSSEYLLYPYNSHVMPGSYAWVWLSTHLFPLSWVPVALAMVALQALVSLVAYRLLVDLFGRRGWILVPLAVVTLSPVSLPASLWWAAALNRCRSSWPWSASSSSTSGTSGRVAGRMPSAPRLRWQAVCSSRRSRCSPVPSCSR